MLEIVLLLVTRNICELKNGLSECLGLGDRHSQHCVEVTVSVFLLQLTWVPNEIEGYDVVVFEFIDRLNEPKGWLLKLWEAVTKGGVVIFLTVASSQWDEAKIRKIIGKWYVLCSGQSIRTDFLACVHVL